MTRWPTNSQPLAWVLGASLRALKKPESNITFGLCLCDPYTCCHSRCSPFPFISIHLGERRKRGRDESYWGWIVLVIKIKHTPPGISCWFSLFPHYFRSSRPPPFLPLHTPKTGEVGNEWETCWQEGAKWIWVMGSWAMCLFNHLVATPSFCDGVPVEGRSPVQIWMHTHICTVDLTRSS